jgi:hypothetical protein
MVFAQEPYFKSSVGVSYASLRFEPQEQYIGYGVDYRYMVRPWLGAQVQASVFPWWQSTVNNDDASGGSIGQLSASALVGHRWGRFGLYGEPGIGYLRSRVLQARQGGGWAFQNYLDIQMGGLLDISVARRWSLTYEVRDNLALVREPMRLWGWPEGSLNVVEGRAGLAFHFQQAGGASLRQQPAVRIERNERELKNSIGISYTTLRWAQYANYASQQWLGAGLEYRFMPRSWVGVQLQASYSPQGQGIDTSLVAGQIVQADAVALVGHRWGKFGVYSEGGFGVLRTRVYGVITPQSFPYPGVDPWRDYPVVPLGGVVDVSLGRRWSVNFNTRDNVTLIGPFSFYGPIYTGNRVTSFGYYPPSTPFVDNLLEVRTGVAFHF